MHCNSSLGPQLELMGQSLAILHTIMLLILAKDTPKQLVLTMYLFQSIRLKSAQKAG
jgi:hypothetical protein